MENKFVYDQDIDVYLVYFPCGHVRKFEIDWLHDKYTNESQMLSYAESLSCERCNELTPEQEEQIHKEYLEDCKTKYSSSLELPEIAQGAWAWHYDETLEFDKSIYEDLKKLIILSEDIPKDKFIFLSNPLPLGLIYGVTDPEAPKIIDLSKDETKEYTYKPVTPKTYGDIVRSEKPMWSSKPWVKPKDKGG